MGFGLVVGAVTAAVQIGMTFMPATLPVHPPAQRGWLAMLAVPLLGSVVTAVVLFEVGDFSELYEAVERLASVSRRDAGAAMR